MPRFSARSLMSVPVGELFAWHERPGAFERLAPPWQRIEVEQRHGGIRDGDRTVLRLHFGPLSTRWVAEHSGYRPDEQFEDVQVQGPFASWHHTHRFKHENSISSWLHDDVEYTPPFGLVGACLAGRKIASDLRRTFTYRHDVTLADLEFHAAFRDAARLRVAITGTSGLLGTALTAMLTTGGHDVLRLVRRPARREDEVEWSPATGVVDVEQLAGIDAFVHLAGENIGAGRWTAERRAAIRSSRVDGTRTLVASLAGCSSPPRTFLAASAVGFYGDTGTGTGTVAEDAPAGRGFLAEVCRDWEAASTEASGFARRVVLGRFGVILSPRGGALSKMLPPFLAGVGGPVGNGRQHLSWISVEDAARAVIHLLLTPEIDGPVNLSAPDPITNRDFTQTLGRVLRRPAILPLPAFAVRRLFGEMGEETLLASTGVRPERLAASGYEHRWPHLESALAHLLGRTDRVT